MKQLSDLKRYSRLAIANNRECFGHFYIKASDVEAVWPKPCEWKRQGSAATETWADTGCGMLEIDTDQINNEMPLIFCPNCGGKIIEAPEAGQ